MLKPKRTVFHWNTYLLKTNPFYSDTFSVQWAMSLNTLEQHLPTEQRLRFSCSTRQCQGRCIRCWSVLGVPGHTGQPQPANHWGRAVTSYHLYCKQWRLRAFAISPPPVNSWDTTHAEACLTCGNHRRLRSRPSDPLLHQWGVQPPHTYEERTLCQVTHFERHVGLASFPPSSTQT